MGLLKPSPHSPTAAPQRSRAPEPSRRFKDFLEVDHPRKFVTIEPILDFDLEPFVEWIREIGPERVYIGYDSRRKRDLPEPSLEKTQELVRRLTEFTVVKLKRHIRKAWWEEGD